MTTQSAPMAPASCALCPRLCRTDRAAGGNLARAVTDEEYEHVLDHADDLGFTTLFWQEGGAVDESFTPAFDTTGVLRAADA